MTFLAVVNAFIFFSLGALHFYWAAGGSWALDAAVPTTLSGQKAFAISVMSCVVVGGGLWAMSFIHLLNAKWIGFNSIFPIVRYATLVIGIIFLIRFVGDFNLVGLFKKVVGTSFARKDSVYFMPLCLFMSVSSFILFFRK